MSELLLQGGRVIDKSGDRLADVLIGSDGLITEIGKGLKGGKTLDVQGKIISSGFVDLNVYLGGPEDQQSETILSGTESAVKGGYTAVVAIAKDPVVADNASSAAAMIEISQDALCEIIVAGSATLHNDAETMSPLGEISGNGIKLFSASGPPLTGYQTTRRIMEYSQKYGITLLYSCSNSFLSPKGAMNEGAVSSLLGIPGIPKVAEAIEVFQLSQLALLTGASLHFQQISTAKSVEIISEAKSNGASITCEISPHHFSLDESLIASFDARYKVLPPLRTKQEIARVKDLITSFDAIATGHSPCQDHLKHQAYTDAPFGTIGLETALGASIKNLDLPLNEILRLLSWSPAEIAGIADTHGGHLIPGRPANLTVFDPDAAWVAKGTHMASKCSVTAFEDIELKGLVSHTLVDGELVVINGVVQDNKGKGDQN
tara:strand:- start:8397 stop:9692 length:1296 start_codon:yes stop_codon:yes gene_type:complete